MADDAPNDVAVDEHARGVARFHFIGQTDAEQRESEIEALAFESGDQWPEDAKLSRQGTPANAALGTPAVPARPMLTMRTLDQPLAQISSMAKAADLGIHIVPKDGEANEKTAKVIAGLVRTIEADSHAEEAYYWGFQRMRACGRGYWRVNKTYANDDGGFDQVLRIEPIENGASVYLDPMPFWHAAGGFWEPDFAFITEDVAEDDYKRRFGKSKLATASAGELLTGMGDAKQDWVVEGEAGRYFRIAEYFYADYDETTEKDEQTGTSREIRTRKIMWCKMNGVEFLEEPQEWDGQFIPIIECTGNKFNVAGKRIYEGMVQPNISACRMLNYMVSAAAEKIGLGTLAPWVGVAGQFQGFEAWWDQANTRNFSKLEYNAVTAQTGNQLLPPPQRNNDEPAIRAFGDMIGLFTNFIRSTTGVPDAALGHVNPNDKSGKAIQSLQRAAEQGASNWLGFLARAIRHTGCVLVDLIPHVYDRPGRVERILGTDDTPETVMLNAPYTQDQNGQPQPAVPQNPSMWGRVKTAVGGAMGAVGAAMGAPPAPAPPPPAVEEHQLGRGHYSVIVDVGKSHDTRKQEALDGMSTLAQAAPQLVPAFADLWVKSMDIPDADAIADRLKPKTDEDLKKLPPEAQAIVQQMQQQLEQAKQAADDNQAKVTIAAHSDAAKVQVAQIQAESARNVAEIKEGMVKLTEHMKLIANTLKVQSAVETADKDRAAGEREGVHVRAHETALTAVEQAHAAEQALMGQRHEAALGVLGQDHEADQATQQRQHEQTQAQQGIEAQQAQPAIEAAAQPVDTGEDTGAE